MSSVLGTWARHQQISSLRRCYLRSGCAGRAGKQMTVPMSVQENIRTLDSQGVAGREIARTLGISRDSVTKYAGQEDYSPERPAPS